MDCTYMYGGCNVWDAGGGGSWWGTYSLHVLWSAGGGGLASCFDRGSYLMFKGGRAGHFDEGGQI